MSQFVGVKVDKSTAELGSIDVAPGFRWNTLSIKAAEVVGVRYEGAEGSFGNIAEIKLYKKC